MKGSTAATRMLTRLIISAALLVPAIAISSPAEASVGVTASVAARLVCGPNGRCYVENGARGYPGGVPYGAPCNHVRNVSYGIGYDWNTGAYSWYRGTQCSKTKSRW